jgi:hypothetical protein
VATTPAKRACPECGTLVPEEAEFCPVCALRQAVQTQSDTAALTSCELRFEHYTVVQNAKGKPFELGRGGMGVTYKAIDANLRCAVALKVINSKLIGDESARRRFVREARAAASVRHPNVASVFHLGTGGNTYFYAMESVEGETLQSLIEPSGRLDLKLVLEITTQVTAGLAAIHEQGLIHRDIKSSNVMVILRDGISAVVKIIDLGLAKAANESASGVEISTPGAFAGTPEVRKSGTVRWGWCRHPLRTHVLNHEIIRWLKIRGATIDALIATESAESWRLDRLYRGDTPHLEVADKEVILVDDGISTFSTFRMAVTVLRLRRAAQIVIAVPIASAASVLEVRATVNAVVTCTVRTTPGELDAVGQWYEDFRQVPQESVRDLYERAKRSFGKVGTLEPKPEHNRPANRHGGKR